jgi:hypothetical protein
MRGIYLSTIMVQDRGHRGNQKRGGSIDVASRDLKMVDSGGRDRRGWMDQIERKSVKISRERKRRIESIKRVSGLGLAVLTVWEETERESMGGGDISIVCLQSNKIASKQSAREKQFYSESDSNVVFFPLTLISTSLANAP